MRDADDCCTAKFPLPLVIWGGDALDQRIHRLPRREELTRRSVECRSSGPVCRNRQTRDGFPGPRTGRTVLDRGLSVQAEQGGPGQVDLQNPPLGVPQKIPDRGKIERDRRQGTIWKSGDFSAALEFSHPCFIIAYDFGGGRPRVIWE